MEKEPVEQSTGMGAAMPFRSAEVSLKVIRANGDVEDLGVVAYWHRNPLLRLRWRISQWLRGKSAGRIKGAFK